MPIYHLNDWMVISTGYLNDFRTLIHARPNIFVKRNIYNATTQIAYGIADGLRGNYEISKIHSNRHVLTPMC